MGYKKKYYNALIAVKKLQEANPNDEGIQNWIDDSFPELKESEDEQSKEWILEYLRDGLQKSDEQFKGQFKAAINRLEKQGESYTKRDVDDAYLECICAAKHELEKQGEQKPIITMKSAEESLGVSSYEYNNIVDDCLYSESRRSAKVVPEKQGEQKPITNVPSRDIILSIWDLGNEWKELTNGSTFTQYGTQLDYIQKHWHESEYYLKEKQGEQKPFDYENANIQQKDFAPKVEPKFKVGNWIVYNKYDKKDIDKIVKFDNDKVSFESGEWLYIYQLNEDCKLWTINDAKDGDVLSYRDEISLYKHDIKNCTKQETTFGGFVYHCCYDGKRFITDSLYSLTEQDKIDIHPATKEQRDLLLKKMKEAGYEWNEEKKELKRIGQKPVWSEEDEWKFSDILALLRGGENCHYNTPELFDWLKSLKERMGG